jgi:hypothetical protein
MVPNPEKLRWTIWIRPVSTSQRPSNMVPRLFFIRTSTV